VPVLHVENGDNSPSEDCSYTKGSPFSELLGHTGDQFREGRGKKSSEFVSIFMSLWDFSGGQILKNHKETPSGILNQDIPGGFFFSLDFFGSKHRGKP
jgi:hypothetical protein